MKSRFETHISLLTGFNTISPTNIKVSLSLIDNGNLRSSEHLPSRFTPLIAKKAADIALEYGNFSTHYGLCGTEQTRELWKC